MKAIFTLHPSRYLPAAHWTTSTGSTLKFRNGLKIFRKSISLTQGQFADSIRYNKNHFTGIENGAKPVTVRVQAAILAAYQPVTLTPAHKFITLRGLEVTSLIGLRAFQHQQGWSRQEMANALCVSVHSVHNWLADKPTPPPLAMQALYLYQELSLCKKATKSP